MTRAEPLVHGVAWLRTLFVNVCFLSTDREWVLVDAGVRGYAGTIRDAARAMFGDQPPAAIVLTHAHFDHVGSLPALLKTWDAPVYAHALELPYLTGRSSYPPPDPLVGGGAMAWMSKLYPRAPLDLGTRVRELPDRGQVPALPGWTWIATPGHTAGHISLMRAEDRTLLAGDAVTTTKQESLTAVMSQRLELHGPPKYYTQNWYAAAQSVMTIAELAPSRLITGHGRPMAEPGLDAALRDLAARFEQDELPERGRYVERPARADERGTLWVPPDPLPSAVMRVAAPVTMALATLFMAGRSMRSPRGLRRSPIGSSHPEAPDS
jgi:glyoxylase-like metal-dependent hydrolase (beta-lactamase superfamily II)